jgi:hypothetical protein
MAVIAAHTSAREMSLSRYQKMTTISTSASTIRAAILVREECLAAPSAACSVIHAPPAGPPKGTSIGPAAPRRQEAGYPAPAARRTGNIAGNRCAAR